MYFEQYVLKATIILILEILDVVPNLHIGKDSCDSFGTFWSYKAFAISTWSILLYFEMTKSFLIIVYLNKPNINIKSKMATINLHTGRDKVSFCVYFDLIRPLLQP